MKGGGRGMQISRIGPDAPMAVANVERQFLIHCLRLDSCLLVI